MNITIMPPYVEPEHRPIIEQAENLLSEYEANLLESVKMWLFESGWDIEPDVQRIKQAERMYMDDPGRKELRQHLFNLKWLFERPRFLVRGDIEPN